MQPSPRGRFTPWLGTAAALLFLAVFPLWQDGSYSRITHAKWVGMLALVGIAAVLSLPALMKKPRLTAAHGWAAAFACWMLLAACFGAYHAQTYQNRLVVWFGTLRYEGMLTKLVYLLIFLLMSLRRPKPVPLAVGVSLSVAAMAAAAALQYAGINVLGLFPRGRSILTNYEFQSTVGNIDMVSGILSLLIPPLLGFTAVRGDWWAWLSAALGTGWLLATGVQGGRFALLFALFVLALIALRRPDVRAGAVKAAAAVCAGAALRGMLVFPWLDGAAGIGFRFSIRPLLWLGLSAGLLTLGSRAARRVGKPLPRKTVLAIGAACLLTAVLLIALLPIPESADALWEAHELLNLRPKDAFGSYRLGVWRVTLGMIADHPLMGHGADTFWFALRDRLNALSLRFPEAYDNPHNELLALAFEGGIPALLLYLGLALSVLRRLRKRADAMGLSLLLGLIGYLAQSLFSFSICLSAPLFWAALGLAAAGETDPSALEARQNFFLRDKKPSLPR